MHYFIVEIVDNYTNLVVAEQWAEASSRAEAARIAMTGRSWRDYSTGYVYREEE